MIDIVKWLVSFYKDEEGASAIEYALIAAMVAIVIAGFVPGIREAITGIFEEIRVALTTQN